MRTVDPVIQQILDYIKKNKLGDSIKYSGKGMNDLGQYDSCLQEGNKYFYLAYLQNLYFSASGVGVCTNQNVTETSLNNTLVATITQYNLSSYINPQLLLPVDANAHSVSISAGYVFVVFMFSLLALFNLLGLVNHFYSIPTLGKVCAAFDPFTNFQQVLTLPKRLNDEYNLDFYEGIRVASTFMVIFGHEYLNRAFYAVNQQQVNDYFTSLGFTGLESLQYSVDIFFYLSGFFISFSLIPRSITKYVQYLVVILYRYLRLMPLYLFMMLFYWQLIYRSTSGPRWPFFKQNTTQACNNMWKNVLFIDNFFKQTLDSCYPWGWYLSNDFQMFLVSLIPISIYKANHKRLGKLTIWFLILFNVLYSLGFNLYYNAGLYNLDITNKFDQFDQVYDKIWQRWAVYYQGLLMGLYFVEFKFYNRQHNIDYKTHAQVSKKQPFFLNNSVILRQSLAFRIVYYILGGSIMIFFFLFKYNYLETLYFKPWSKTTQQFFNVVERPGFILGLIIFLMPPLLQTSHYTKQFLGCYIFKFLSKLSYPMYLIHFQIQQYGVYSERQNVYFSFANMLSMFIYDTLLTIFFSIIAQIFIEYPFANLQAQLIKRPETKKYKIDNDEKLTIDKSLDEKLLQNQNDYMVKEETK